MADAPIIVLLVEDHIPFASVLQETLKAGAPQMEIVHVERLSSALERLGQGGIDAVLLDLSLPDSRGLDTLDAVHSEVPEVPIVILTATDNKELAIQAVSMGAQDYLVKIDVDGPLLVRSLRYAIERNVTQRNLVQAEKQVAIGQVVAGMARNLNQPLGVILEHVRRLARSDLEPNATKRYLRIVLKEAERSSKSVRDMIAVGREEADRSKPLNLNEELASVREINRDNLAFNDIDVEMNLAGDLPKVLGDSGEMQTVFVNLLHNARDAMSEAHGKGRLRIETGHTSDTVQVTVADDGPGIRPEHLTQVFEPFFSAKDGAKGLGLGLSICRTMVLAHGGRIWVESEYGKGAAFRLEFPVAPKGV